MIYFLAKENIQIYMYMYIICLKVTLYRNIINDKKAKFKGVQFKYLLSRF